MIYDWSMFYIFESSYSIDDYIIEFMEMIGTNARNCIRPEAWSDASAVEYQNGRRMKTSSGTGKVTAPCGHWVRLEFLGGSTSTGEMDVVVKTNLAMYRGTDGISGFLTVALALMLQ